MRSITQDWRSIAISPWTLIAILTLAVSVGMFGIRSMHEVTGDYVYYQRFAESLAQGRLDLSIPGFHGIDVITAIVYFFTRSPSAHLWVQQLSGLLLPLMAFLAARTLYRDDRKGMIFAFLVSIMPFISFVYVTGYTQAGNDLLFLLSLYCAALGSRWTWFPLALAILTKPFCIIALPFILLCAPEGTPLRRRIAVLSAAIALPALYWAVQYLSVGQIIIGVHPEHTETSIWTGPMKFARNIAYGIQALFSVHNFQPENPGATPLESFTHTSPILNMLGVLALLNPKKYFSSMKQLHIALFIGIIAGYILCAAVSMNDYYMQFTVLLLALAALPVLLETPLMIVVAALTLHISWFYFLLVFGKAGTTPLIYTPLVVADLLMVGVMIAKAKHLLHLQREHTS